MGEKGNAEHLSLLEFRVHAVFGAAAA